MAKELESRVTIQVDFTLLPDSPDITAVRMAEMVETYFGVQLEAPVRAKVVSGFVVTRPKQDGSIEVDGTTYFPATDEDEDDHCESDGSQDCLVHHGRFGVVGGEFTDVCDLSPDWEDV
jgi:hypothetical protein